MRILCMRLPQLPIEVEIQRKPQLARKPLVLLRPCNQRVLIASKSLSDIGIIPGESRRSVEQRYPNAFFLTATEDLYQKKHTQLKNILGRFCADIESNSLGEFFISITMLSRIFKSEDDLSVKVIQQIVSETQLPVTVAIAGNKFTAYCASLQADPTCTIPTGKEADFLASLPLTHLINPPSELLRRLNIFGIRTLGEFAQLPHGSVVRQFGPELAHFHDMACGNDARNLQPLIYPPTIILSKTLPDPLSDIRPAQNILQKLAIQLSQHLEKSGYHANALILSITDEDNVPDVIFEALKLPILSLDIVPEVIFDPEIPLILLSSRFPFTKVYKVSKLVLIFDADTTSPELNVYVFVTVPAIPIIEIENNTITEPRIICFLVKRESNFLIPLSIVKETELLRL